MYRSPSLKRQGRDGECERPELVWELSLTAFHHQQEQIWRHAERGIFLAHQESSGRWFRAIEPLRGDDNRLRRVLREVPRGHEEPTACGQESVPRLLRSRTRVRNAPSAETRGERATRVRLFFMCYFFSLPTFWNTKRSGAARKMEEWVPATMPAASAIAK